MTSARPATPSEQVATALRSQIEDGSYAIGDQLPPIEKLADAFAVSHMTVKRALGVLREEGIVATRSGVRTQVIARPSETAGSLQDQIDQLRTDLSIVADRLTAVETHIENSTTRAPELP